VAEGSLSDRDVDEARREGSLRTRVDVLHHEGPRLGPIAPPELVPVGSVVDREVERPDEVAEGPLRITARSARPSKRVASAASGLATATTERPIKKVVETTKAERVPVRTTMAASPVGGPAQSTPAAKESQTPGRTFPTFRDTHDRFRGGRPRAGHSTV
jgi:hypothetical protein